VVCHQLEADFLLVEVLDQVGEVVVLLLQVVWVVSSVVYLFELVAVNQWVWLERPVEPAVYQAEPRQAWEACQF